MHFNDNIVESNESENECNECLTKLKPKLSSNAFMRYYGEAQHLREAYIDLL